jgi:hypothetical protein
MDDKLADALDFSNYMITLDNQKRLLKEQYNNDIIYYHNGGQFTLTYSLISFCATMTMTGQLSSVLIDDNSTPIHIDHLQEFANNTLTAYTKAGNKYLTEFSKLKNNRTVEGIID